MVRFDITLIGEQEIINRLASLDTKAADKARKVASQSANRIVRDARRRVPVDTGTLRDSIQAITTDDGLTYRIVARTHYALFVELGTRPHFPPPRALRGWAERHGLGGLEFAIARRISQRGTKKRPYLFPAWNKERPVFLAKMAQALRELGE